jgi:predicted dinucleotide-binding enzyme
LRAALAELPAWNNRVVIDATNAMVPLGTNMEELKDQSSSDFVASLVPEARVVKVCNTLPRALLASNPREYGGHRVLFMSGNDDDAKALVNEILEKAGFATIDLGLLATGAKLQQVPGGPLATLNLIKFR